MCEIFVSRLSSRYCTEFAEALQLIKQRNSTSVPQRSILYMDIHLRRQLAEIMIGDRNKILPIHFSPPRSRPRRHL